VFIVYWLHDPAGARVKVGITHNLVRRIREVEREFRCSVEVVRAELVTTRAEAHRLEAALHWHHRALHLQREWFQEAVLGDDTPVAQVLRGYRDSRVVEVRLPRELLAALKARGLSLEAVIILGLQ
jgi:hypothetical protein